MADRTLVLSWGRPTRGREERALESFNDAVGFYGRMQQDGKIEAFDIVLLAPNAEMGGFFLLHGSAAQLHVLKEDPSFTRLVADAQMCVDDIRLIDGYTGEGVADQMAIYTEAIGKVLQPAS